MARRVGFLVNPIAGLGGRTGLHGTDGHALVTEALRRGATPVTPPRAARALRRLASRPELTDAVILAAPGAMGADLARETGLRIEELDVAVSDPTTAADTIAAAHAEADRWVDLILFAGGDGTAADILSAVGTAVPLLGIPSGVKMRSGIFATTPEAAGDAVADYLARLKRAPEDQFGSSLLRAAEVIDAPKSGPPADHHGNPGVGALASELCGVALVPRSAGGRLVGAKQSSSLNSDAAVDALAAAVADELDPRCLYLVGPGTTTGAVLAKLEIEGTPMGVDAVANGRLLGADLSETDILTLMDAYPRTRLIVGVVGGQGMLLGRGNQQLGPRVLSRISPDGVMILSSADKLVALRPPLLYVDTGDKTPFPWIAGYRRVRVAPNRYMLLRVSAA